MLAGRRLLERLGAAGARTDAVNHDGFGLLHAVAETNRAELVALMGASAYAELERHCVAFETSDAASRHPASEA